MERKAYIERNLDDLFLRWVERATLGGCVLFLASAALDYFVTPGNFPRFLAYRSVISLLLIASYFLLRRAPRRYVYLVAYLLVAATAATVELMIIRFGGHESPYSIGIILLGISVTGFLPAPFRFHVLVAGTIYLIYLVPLLVTAPAGDHSDFIIVNVSMPLIFCTMLLMRYLTGKTLVDDLGLRYDLERYREHLEEVVADRTAELAGAIENLRQEIAERKRSEEDRNVLQEQLLQMQKMESVGRLAGGIAHDFNNVLTAIMSYTELCLMKLPEEHDVHAHLQGIRDASEKAAGLTHRLLAFSRKQELAMQAVDLSAVVESMAGMLKRVIGEDIDLALDTTKPLRMIPADVGQIEQVVMNLAVNARDAMPQGGSLKIGTTEIDVDHRAQHGIDSLAPGDYVLLTVSDSGTGMSREVRDRIFEPFFTTKELGMGIGLGLATVYGIVKQHSGSIYVESDPGCGTIFRVYLPAGNAKPLVAQTEVPSVLPRGSEVVLVVEDDQVIRSLLREVLESLGYRVVEASVGGEAVLKAKAFCDRIDLLLTDVVMPGMNGQELADALRRDRSELRTLYLSGYTPDILIRQGLLEPGAALVLKPLTTGVLAQAVRKVLDATV